MPQVMEAMVPDSGPCQQSLKAVGHRGRIKRMFKRVVNTRSSTATRVPSQVRTGTRHAQPASSRS